MRLEIAFVLVSLGVVMAACASTKEGTGTGTGAAPAHGDGTGHGHGHGHGAGMKHEGGHHRFDNAEEWAKRFDDPARDAWQKPDDVVRGLALEGDELVADIGAGTGYFAMRLARAVPRGKVFAVDVEQDMVRYLGERAAKEGLTNVVPVLAPLDGPALPETVELVLVVNTIHHIENRTPYFTKVKEKLAPGGRVVIVDFKMGEIPVGPPEAMRLPAATVTAEMKAAGLELVKLDETTLPHQYIATFRAPAG